MDAVLADDVRGYGRAIRARLGAEGIDLGNGGSTGILFEAANNGTDAIQVVAAGRSEGRNQGGAAIIVRRDSPLRTLADLKGWRVSVMRGTGTQYILERDLEKLGGGQKDVAWSFLPNDLALAAVTAGHIDALGIWEPQASALLQRPDLRLLTWVGSNGDSYDLQFASRKALTDPLKRAAIADFLQRLARSTVWASAHPAQFAQAISRSAGIQPEIAQIIVAKTATRYGLSPAEQAQVRAKFSAEADFWHRRGVIHGPVAIDKIFDPAFEPQLIAATAGH